MRTENSGGNVRSARYIGNPAGPSSAYGKSCKVTLVIEVSAQSVKRIQNFADKHRKHWYWNDYIKSANQ